MKNIPLKVIGEKDSKFDYKETLLSLLRNAPLGSGFTMEEVRLSIRIIDKVEKAKDTVEIAGDEHEYLKKILSRSRFNRASKELIEFIDDING